MIAEKAEFTDFRNLECETVSFSPGINVICGENAQGKTNIIEGIYLFARGRSFRISNDRELVRFGADTGYVNLFVRDNRGEKILGAQIDRKQTKRFYRDRARVERTSDMIGEFRSVLFCPSHLGLVNDAPSLRRNFLDVAISQINPVYMKTLAKYNSILAQRNFLVKKSQINDVFEVYSEELSRCAAYISEKRDGYIKKLSEKAKIYFSEMTEGRESPEFSYISNCGKIDFSDSGAVFEKFRRMMRENTEKEIRYGASLFGTHRDDIKIELNGSDARFFASQGQKRSIVLSMKLSEGEISREESGEEPVMLLDDVLSELDRKRRKYIISKIVGRQVIMTSCETPRDFRDANKIRIKAGRVQ